MRVIISFVLLLLFVPANAHAGDVSPEELLDLGGVAFDNGNKEEAFEWYLKAAERGHPKAQHNIGEMYFFAQGVDPDHSKALKWYLKAAEQGNMSAQFKAARIYFTEQDFSNAFEWYLKAAEQGHMSAQGMVGSFYIAGAGVSQDIEKGKEWYRRAVKQGSKNAEKALQLLEESESRNE